MAARDGRRCARRDADRAVVHARAAGVGRRIDEQMLAEVLEPLGAGTRAYACGPAALVETVANGLVRLGLPPDRIRTERFGPTGT